MSATNLTCLEPAHDVLRETRRRPLEALLASRNVAIIGATESPGSVGRTLVENLNPSVYGGPIYLVNPKRSTVLGRACHPNLAAIPEPVELAVIVTPAASVPGIIEECVAAGVQGAIIISAGFKEAGPAGVELERKVLATARRGRMRIIGPNCLGVMMPYRGFNATFAHGMARPGNVGFLSQSGAFCTAILDWSYRENVGFSAFISVGSMLDVDWGDLIYYLGDDPHTRGIVIYMETIGNARSFLSAAREVALTKPIIVIKVGRSEAAAKAAASHTGSLTGSDEVLDAAFRRVGVLRVNSIDELFDMSEVLAKQPRPKGPRLAIVTNAGGPAVMATDMLITHGGELAPLGAETLAALNSFLPPHWSRGNPVDILGDAGPEQYAKAVEIAAKDANTDGLLVILTPQAMTDPTATATQLKPYAHLGDKPILASWMGGPQVEAGRMLLNSVDIPTFAYPDRAARAFSNMWRYSKNLRSLYETPSLPSRSEENGEARDRVEAIIQKALLAGRTLLTEAESKQLLQAYDLPVVETRIANTQDEAVAWADQIGYPAVLKLCSETITHKTDVGGVQLNLSNADEVRRAWSLIESSVEEKAGPGHFQGVTVQPMVQLGGYELIVGSSPDSQFGPVLLFGAGGALVEVFKDRALGLPPLNATLARRLMEQTRIYTALQGVRGRAPVDLAALEQLLVRFSHLVVEQPWIAEIDMNPLLASADRLIALDARVVLHDPRTKLENLPKPAIRPYPTQYVTRGKMKDGTPVTFRPIRPEDEPLMAQFHQTLSERSVYYRYFSPLQLQQRIAHERLTRICFIDYDRELALVAERRDPATGHAEILGVGRLSRAHGRNEAEFAVLVGDPWQKRGLGAQLLKLLVQVGKSEKLNRISGRILPDNHPMRKLCQKAGFTLRHPEGETDALAELVF